MDGPNLHSLRVIFVSPVTRLNTRLPNLAGRLGGLLYRSPVGLRCYSLPQRSVYRAYMTGLLHYCTIGSLFQSTFGYSPAMPLSLRYFYACFIVTKKSTGPRMLHLHGCPPRTPILLYCQSKNNIQSLRQSSSHKYKNMMMIVSMYVASLAGRISFV